MIRTAVIVTDIQGDFTELNHGSLAVPGTDQHYVNDVESATRKLKQAGFLIIATQDWHPPDHVSFFTNHPGKKPFDTVTVHGRQQILWPPHCVQDSDGAQVIVDQDLFDTIVRKGTQKKYESYSAFKDESETPTGLLRFLQDNNVERLIIYGLATDYCVRATALDAVDYGYQVIVIKNLSRGVASETTKAALEEMKIRGIQLLDSLDEETIRACRIKSVMECV